MAIGVPHGCSQRGHLEVLVRELNHLVQNHFKAFPELFSTEIRKKLI